MVHLTAYQVIVFLSSAEHHMYLLNQNKILCQESQTKKLIWRQFVITI